MRMILETQEDRWGVSCSECAQHSQEWRAKQIARRELLLERGWLWDRELGKCRKAKPSELITARFQIRAIEDGACNATMPQLAWVGLGDVTGIGIWESPTVVVDEKKVPACVHQREQARFSELGLLSGLRCKNPDEEGEPAFVWKCSGGSGRGRTTFWVKKVRPVLSTNKGLRALTVGNEWIRVPLDGDGAPLWKEVTDKWGDPISLVVEGNSESYLLKMVAVKKAVTFNRRERIKPGGERPPVTVVESPTAEEQRELFLAAEGLNYVARTNLGYAKYLEWCQWTRDDGMLVTSIEDLQEAQEKLASLND